MTVSGDSNLTSTADAIPNGVKPSWEELGAKKRSDLQASIPREWRIPDSLLPPLTQDDVTGWPEESGWFTVKELAITNMTAAELLSKMAAGELKSEDVTRAFCKRASAAHQLVSFSLA
jgi:amidase